MNNKEYTTVKKYTITIFIACCFVPGAVTAQSECTDATSVSADEIIENADSICCSRSTNRRQRRCLKKAIRTVKRADDVISEEVSNTAQTLLRELRSASCEIDEVTLPECTDEGATTIDEASNNISEFACDKRYKDKRRKSLKRAQRLTKKARQFVGTDYYNEVKEQITSLRQSDSCGQGGEERQNSCGRVVNPRDGGNVGNVYKLGDHTGTPVFITHNGARSGRAITTTGSQIRKLRYTGLANPDPKGKRHHYRLDVSCRSLPNPYLLEIGSTCYTINNPCGRID